MRSKLDLDRSICRNAFTRSKRWWNNARLCARE
jgi:hypothetical protein